MEEKMLIDFAVEARKYKTQLTEKFANRKEWNNPDEGDLFSLLPGTVLSINVEVGAVVKTGDLLFIHEAMKMQNRIIAPFDGLVAEICVKEGERIGKNHLMIKLKKQ